MSTILCNKCRRDLQGKQAAPAASAKLQEWFTPPAQVKHFKTTANDQSDQGKKEELNASISPLSFCCIEIQKVFDPWDQETAHRSLHLKRTTVRCPRRVTWWHPTSPGHCMGRSVELEGLTFIKATAPNGCFGALAVDTKKTSNSSCVSQPWCKRKTWKFSSQVGWPLPTPTPTPAAVIWANRRWTQKLPKCLIPQRVWERLSRQYFPCYTPFIWLYFLVWY